MLLSGGGRLIIYVPQGVDEDVGLLEWPELAVSDGVVALGGVLSLSRLLLLFLDFEAAAVALLVEIALLELLDQIEDGLDFALVGLAQGGAHVPLDWLELSELEYQLGEV